uniref:DUF4371 domain-containing protein n=1 Tax=Cyprinus carpio TaxID=7962 RepID=A0A8C1WF61_CYPCA
NILNFRRFKTISSSSLLASYEELFVPAAAILAEKMLDKKAAKAIKTVPLSNDTVCRRIDDMAEDIVAQVVDNLKWTTSFALQLDESTDISSKSQFVAFVRYKDDISEHVLFCKPMLAKTTGPTLIKVLNDAVKIINFIKSRPLNARLFKKLCNNVGTEHHQLLLHTDVRWLARGKTLQRLFELQDQVVDFLSEHLHPLAALLKDYNWLAHLAYLADIFSRLNELNLELQGTDTSFLHDGDLSSFSQLNRCILNGGDDKVSTPQIVQTHMCKLSSEFKLYFPNIEVQNSELDWIRNPFVANSIETAPVSLQERLIDLSSDRGLKIIFSETPLTKIWCSVEKEYPDGGKYGLYRLLAFGSTYLCEVTFSAMANIKTIQRNREKSYPYIRGRPELQSMVHQQAKHTRTAFVQPQARCKLDVSSPDSVPYS